MSTPEHQKGHKKRKRITAQNLYQPKRLTLRNYTRFINQFIDRYNWGSIGINREKKFHFSVNLIENAQYKSNVRLREKPNPNPRYRDIAISDHLNARQDPDGFVFYTSNIFSDLCLLCGDIDPIEGCGFEECLEAFYYLEKNYFPNCYWEPSTTYRGIHFYIIIDFSTFSREYNLFHRSRCNEVIDKLSALFSELINSMYYCKFDRFFGTYPVYNPPFSSFEFIERGKMAKLPLPQNDYDFDKLVHTPILSYSNVDNMFNYILQIVRPQTIISGGKEIIETPIPTQAITEGTLPPNSLCRDVDYLTKNDEYLNSTSAWDRTLHSTMKLTRELGRIPEYEEWNEYYEQNGFNTGEETELRKERHAHAVKLIQRTFDPSKIGHIYKVGEFTKDLRNDISAEQIKAIVKNMTKYRYTITYEDLEVGLGTHWTLVRKNQKLGNELVVPINAIVNMFKSLKKKREINRSCERDKARAIRVVLQQMNYIYCIDSHSSRKKGNHIAQRWGMAKNFPKYQDYLLFCGDAEQRAHYAKKMRESSLETNSVVR